MTRPPSSRPVAPDLPSADHRLQPLPSMIPLATLTAWLVSVAAAVLVTGDCGEQPELAPGTFAIPGKLAGKLPGGCCQMPWLAVIGTRLPALQLPKPRLCSAETPGEVVLSSRAG